MTLPLQSPAPGGPFKSELRADDYRSRALDAGSLADASPLTQVQERQRAAEAAWLELAAWEDQRTAHAQAVARRIAEGSVPAEAGEDPS